ncbi:MAG: cupin domain-containing protein [Flavobacteriaceae bacterium]
MAIKDYITRSTLKEWTPLIENEVHYEGVFVKSLRFDVETNRSKTILLKFEPNASYPYHSHPAGEEIFVLEGECAIVDEKLQQGDYLYTPPKGTHSVRSDKGCVLLLSVPEEVELL